MSEEGCVVVEGELEELLELFELVERIGWLERLELLFLKVFFFELVVVGTFLKLILRSGTQADRKRRDSKSVKKRGSVCFFIMFLSISWLNFYSIIKKATKKGQEEILPLFVIIDARLQVHRLEVRHLREHHRLQAWSWQFPFVFHRWYRCLHQCR